VVYLLTLYKTQYILSIHTLSPEFFFPNSSFEKLEVSPPTIEHKVEDIQYGNFPVNCRFW